MAAVVNVILMIMVLVSMRASVSSGNLLRLVPSSSSYYSSGGRLEVYYSSSWRPFCSTYFNSHEADLACKKLGYRSASSYGRVGSLGYSQGSGTYSMSTSCSSYYTSFDSCSLSTTYCSHYYDVAITCRSSTYSTTTSPTTSSLRLVSSSSNVRSSGGRLEIYYYYRSSYAWRPFCSTYFSSHEADLACKQLGYQRASRYGRVGSLGYSMSSSSYSVIPYCYSYNTRFYSCSKSVTSSCSASYNVAINCVNDLATNYSYSNNRYIYRCSIGQITGLVVGSFVFLCCCCTGIIGCSVVITCLCYKKKSSGVRTVNVTQTQPDYKMSELPAQENATLPSAAPPCTPSPFPPPFTPTMQQEGNPYVQKAGIVLNDCPAYGEVTKNGY